MTGKRILWLDNARAFAILLVILVHATECIYTMNTTGLNSLSLESRLFAISTFSIGRLGVPIFLFLTGYLFLDRVFTSDKCIRFWKKNWLSLVITTEIWIVLYDVFLRLFHFTPHWNTMNLIKDMFFLTQVNMGHMWYMSMIIGMYPCIPFIARGLQNLNTKLLTFPLLFYLTYAFFTTDGFVLDLGFSGGVYGIYIVLGYCVKKGLLKSFGKYQLLIVSGMFTSFVILKQAYFCTHGGISMVWYDSGLLLMAALFLFEYISRIHIIGKQMWWNWLSRNSFGI